jgi:hypothetical protein
MAIRIQLRRDTAANWTSSNPTLRAGEIGIETDTLKFKIGNGSSTWTQITTYANVTPSGLSSSLGSYILASTQGSAGGPAELDSNGDLIVPENSIILWNDADYDYTTTLTATQPTADRTITIPNVNGTVITTGDTASVTNAMLAGSIENAKLTNSSVTINTNSLSLGGSLTLDTDDVLEGTTNKYFADDLAQDAVAQALANGTHTNITVTYNDNANSISLAAAPGYTDEQAQDAIGNSVGNGLDYDDNTGAISVDPSEFALSAVGAPTANVSMATYKITGLGEPTQSSDAATKFYVDNTTAGINFHAPAHTATTTNLAVIYDNGTNGVGATLTADTNRAWNGIDSHTTFNVGDRILVKNQTDAKQNGMYTLTQLTAPWILTRATDADNSPAGELAYGDFVFVQNGGQAGYGFIVNTIGTITVGVTDISYVQFNAGQVVVAGNGLSEATAGTLSIDTAITVDLNTAQTLTNKTITGTFTGNVTGDVSGNAGTVTNGVVSTGSYSDPSWITSLAASKVGLGNVENTALSTWAGSSNIITLGTIATGTWEGTKIAADKGGTGLTSYASGDILYASASNSLASLAKGTNGQILTLASGLPSWADAPITLPTQTGNSGKYLTTNGTVASWATLVVPITTGTATITTNTINQVDAFVMTPQTIEYTLSIVQGSKVRSSKVLVHSDGGTSVDMTEYSIMELGGNISGVLVTATNSASAGYLNVTVTDAATTNATVKFSKIVL